jgi:hypothetical protein
LPVHRPYRSIPNDAPLVGHNSQVGSPMISKFIAVALLTIGISAVPMTVQAETKVIVHHHYYHHTVLIAHPYHHHVVIKK